MQTEHDEEAPEGADDETGDGRREADDGEDGIGDEVAEDRGDGADDEQSDDTRDGEREEVGEEGPDERGNDRREALVDLGGEPLHHDDGDDGRGVALEHQGDAEDVPVHVGREDGAGRDGVKGIGSREGDDRGIDEHGANGHAEGGLETEALACGPADDDREVVEDRVADGVEDGVGRRALVEPARDGGDGEKGLDEAACHQHAEHRLEDLGDQAEEPGERVGLLAVGAELGILVHVERCLGREATHLDEVGVDRLDGGTDDDLVLTGGLDDVEDALRGLERGGVGLGLVLETEAQPGDAMAHVDDVVLAPNSFDDLVAEILVLHHVLLFGREYLRSVS